VQGPEEGTVVDETSRQGPVEALGQGLFSNRHRPVVEGESGLWALDVEGDVAEVDPGVDATLVMCDELLQEDRSFPVVAGAVQIGCLGDRIGVPIVFVEAGNDLFHLEFSTRPCGDDHFDQWVPFVFLTPVLLCRVPSSCWPQRQGNGQTPGSMGDALIGPRLRGRRHFWFGKWWQTEPS